MKYSVKRRADNQTSREDHGRWLRVLEDGVTGPVVSIHFTANPRGPVDLNNELHSMFQDGADRKFEVLEFRHANYVTVVHFKNHEGLTHGFAESLGKAVNNTWERWFGAAESLGRPAALYVTSRRKIFG